MNENIKHLTSGPRHLFFDWPVAEVPEVAAGLYSIWKGDQFVYIGMSGRSATPEELERRRQIGKTFGLFNRLAAHASGRRSGDQFCVYVADVFVLPQLTTSEIRRYVALDQPLDCAGSFKAEGLGLTLFDDMRGRDIHTLYGLPLLQLLEVLRNYGINPISSL